MLAGEVVVGIETIDRMIALCYRSQLSSPRSKLRQNVGGVLAVVDGGLGGKDDEGDDDESANLGKRN